MAEQDLETRSGVGDEQGEEVQEERDTYLIFRLDQERYAVPVHKADEVVEYQKITFVPRSPDFLLGIINLRGQLVPVMDMRRRFGLEDGEVTDETRIMILNVVCGDEEIALGVLVDEVSGVIDLNRSDIDPPPQFGTGAQEGVIQATARTSDGIVLVLDPDALLTEEFLSESFRNL
jgi:purine-binding chemotaxis protein CheW